MPPRSEHISPMPRGEERRERERKRVSVCVCVCVCVWKENKTKTNGKIKEYIGVCVVDVDVAWV